MRGAAGGWRGEGAALQPDTGSATGAPAVAAVLGYPPGASDQLVNDYLRATRRAHDVVELEGSYAAWSQWTAQQHDLATTGEDAR